MLTDEAMKEAHTIIAEHYANGRGLDGMIAESIDLAYARGRAEGEAAGLKKAADVCMNTRYGEDGRSDPEGYARAALSDAANAIDALIPAAGGKEKA